MASLPIRWILGRTYCQATEEEDRVVQALEAAIAGGTPSRDRLEGQFGNPVLVLVRKLERAEEIRATWGRWQDTGLLGSLPGDLESRLDGDGVLHFRLDKQAAYRGSLLPAGDSDAIDIQVKLKAYPAKPEEILKVARSLIAEAG